MRKREDAAMGIGVFGGLFVGFMLGACVATIIVDNHITTEEVIEAVERCRENEGVNRVSVDALRVTVICNNEAKFLIPKV